MSKLSPRAERAVEMMKVGAKFVERLEMDSYTRIEKFACRLLVNGKPAKGYGFATFHELNNAGMLAISNRTTVSTYYNLVK